VYLARSIDNLRLSARSMGHMVTRPSATFDPRNVWRVQNQCPFLEETGKHQLLLSFSVRPDTDIRSDRTLLPPTTKRTGAFERHVPSQEMMFFVEIKRRTNSACRRVPVLSKIRDRCVRAVAREMESRSAAA
jgi:hypothetical protein